MLKENSQYKKGMIAAVSCSFFWGILPIYWQSLRPIESSVIIFYRIFLVGMVCFLVALKMYGMKSIKAILKDKTNVLIFVLAGALITGNWSIYIWAVNANYVIQTCIGYYIEPLMVCVFGAVFFKEKMNKYKLTAFIFACCGLFVILVHFGQFPILAIALAVTFATYAALKKSVNVPPLLSLLCETIFLMPIALVIIIYLEINNRGAIGIGEPYQYVLLMFSGIFTAIPLILFGDAANKVSLISLGLVEYISPSIALIIGIFLLEEPFDGVQLIAFIIIWIGLTIFTYGEIKNGKKL